MNSLSYQTLLDKFIRESRDDVDYKLISKHKFELAIFPQLNQFKLGEEVLIDIDNLSYTGFIENFNSNGTLFIKTNFSDIGKDYSLSFIKKLHT